MTPNMKDFDDVERKISFSFSPADRYITKQAVERALQCSMPPQHFEWYVLSRLLTEMMTDALP
jgi:hypothetical protein